MSAPDAAAIARASYEAYARKDRAAIEALVAADFHFTSPLDNRIDRSTYFQRCWPGCETIESFAFIRLVADGQTVFVTYEGQRDGGKRFRNTEIMTVRDTVRDGKIAAVEVYFGWDVPHPADAGRWIDAA